MKHAFTILPQTKWRMKKMLLFALFTIIFLLSGCEVGIKQPPKAVRQTFDTMFPGATHVEWEKMMSSYKADFHHEGRKKEAQFNSTGAWERTKTELTIFDVPDPVMNTAQEYCDCKIDDITLHEQASGVPAFYLFEYDFVETSREKKLRIFPDGTVMFRF
jgi:hypothetical protein